MIYFLTNFPDDVSIFFSTLWPARTAAPAAAEPDATHQNAAEWVETIRFRIIVMLYRAARRTAGSYYHAQGELYCN